MERGKPRRRSNRASRSAVAGRQDGAMVRADYQDDEGRWWATLVPEGQEQDAHMGIPIGPPDLSPLGLSPAQEVRLHNQLFHRGILTAKDLRGRGRDVFAAVQAAWQVDVSAVTRLYR